MLNSTVLEVAFGLIFCFASISLITSAMNEAMASIFKLRGRRLLAGVQLLLNDPQFNGLALALYNHAMINPQSVGNAEHLRDIVTKPSYIPSRHFAVALIDVLQAPGNAQSIPLDQALGALKDDQLRPMLLGMVRRAAGNEEKLHAELEGWFDNGMARVAGGYKRRSQLTCFVIALLIAVLFNIDSIHVFETLWIHPALAAQLSLAQYGEVNSAIAQLTSLPVGWAQAPDFYLGSMPTWVMMLGWLLTASSVLFGAPFWFDLLQKLTHLRGTGAKPGKEGAP